MFINDDVAMPQNQTIVLIENTIHPVQEFE